MHISEVKRVIYFYLKQQLEIENLLYDMNHTNSECENLNCQSLNYCSPIYNLFYINSYIHFYQIYLKTVLF